MEKGTKVTAGRNIHHQVMICGATGFIGSHLVAQLLKEGYKNVHIISRTISSCSSLEKMVRHYGVEEEYNNVNIHYGEINNYKWLVETFAECHTIFNCASQVNMGGKSGSQLIIDNTTLTYLIAEAAVEAKVNRIVHVSSIAALAAQKFPTFTTEENHLQTLKGESAYAISKFYSENEMWRIAEKGIHVIIVNPAVVLGYGDLNGGSSTKIVKEIAKGVPFYTSGIMGYVMVEDVARAMIMLSVTDEAIGERFILCGANLCYKDLFKMISHAMHSRAPFMKIADWLIIGYGKLMMVANFIGIKTKFSNSLARNLVSKHNYDGSKVTRYTAFEYSDLENAISQMGVAYKKK